MWPRSVARRQIAPVRHLLAMIGNNARDLIAREHFAPLVGAPGAEELLALDRHFDEAIAALHRRERGEACMLDRAFDASAIRIQADQTRYLAEPFGRLLEQILVAHDQDARAFQRPPARH